MRRIDKPDEGEYAPYAIMYMSLVPDDGRVLDHLEASLAAITDYARSLSEEQLAYRYAPGKWTVKDIIAHLSDGERIFVYRALRFARHDPTELPGFDQDPYVVHAGANGRSIGDLLDELTAVRRATLAFFASLDDEALLRRGVANGHPMSVRAAAYHIAGHELHHLRVLGERYFPVS
jgi:uncharacterized damage-inducible protein DinB